MGYAIVGGAGLAVGLGLMIWALSERAKRHRAEREADAARKRESEACDVADAAHRATLDLRAENKRLEKQIAYIRKRLETIRGIIRAHAPMSVVKGWLDDEGKGGKI